jgi:hypothetical protein
MNSLALHNNSIREHIHHLISAIIPYDDSEQEHIRFCAPNYLSHITIEA